MSNKLLLADDSITIQKVVGIIFANEEDYELTVVDNGDAALEKAKQIVPDIILVDALMPGKNGYEVCAGIRQDSKLQSVPLLLMTGAFEPFDEDKARQSGADDFISKPFESQQLIDRVKKLIELGKERRTAPAVEPSVEVVSPEPVFSPVTEPIAAPANDLAQAFAVESPMEEKAEEVFALGDEAVEGNLDDDLWGAFEMEDLPSGGAAASAAVATAFAAVPVAPDAAGEEFSFADINDDLGQGTPVEATVEEQPFETGWEPVDEQIFAFQEDEPADVGAIESAPLAAPSEFAFVPEAESAADDFFFEESVESVMEEPASPVASEPAQVAAPAAAVQATPAPAAPQAAITEAQLVAALSNLSREVIEKIVWEVVPDLAEVLIKEEIRKLKEGSGR
jgi:CheY-like chemotaxis protein